MKKTIVIIIALVLTIGLGAGAYAYLSRDDNGATSDVSPTVPSEAQVPAEATDGQGTYEPYAPSKLANAKDGKVVLFFNAKWCPDCRRADKNLSETANRIPAGVTILSVDYDKYTDLRKKYGVTYQHQFVQVDENGNEIKQWSGSSTVDDILEQLKG